MMKPPLPITYPYNDPPKPGRALEIAPGVKWLQMPLPMSLRHINLYLIAEEDGWVIIDTGIRGTETADLWQQIITNELDGKPIKRIVCTHMHPDHTGQTGYLQSISAAPLYMSYAEFYQATFINHMMKYGANDQRLDHYLKLGFSAEFLESLKGGRGSFEPREEDLPMPETFIRLVDEEVLKLGQNEWTVIVGSGHSPEHVCLYCPSLRLLISGDQILPIITSNVSVYPTEPEANPMLNWLASHEKFKALLPDDILVLPAHNLPFYGIQTRLNQLIEHHEDRMLIIEENCQTAQIATTLLPLMFSRKLEGHTRVMAMGECVAHLHCLMARGRIERTLQNGIYHYLSVDPALAARAKPGQHEAPDELPILT